MIMMMIIIIIIINYQFCLLSPTTLLSIPSSGSVELEL